MRTKLLIAAAILVAFLNYSFARAESTTSPDKKPATGKVTAKKPAPAKTEKTPAKKPAPATAAKTTSNKTAPANTANTTPKKPVPATTAGKTAAKNTAPSKTADKLSAKDAEIKSFADKVCKTATKSNKEFSGFINVEFLVRITTTDEMLKKANMTLAQAVKANEAQLTESAASSKTLPKKCSVSTVKSIACDALYGKIATSGSLGKIDAAKITAAGKAMKLNVCGTASIMARIVSKTKDQDVEKEVEKDMTVDFGFAKVKGAWKIISFTMPKEIEKKK